LRPIGGRLVIDRSQDVNCCISSSPSVFASLSSALIFLQQPPEYITPKKGISSLLKLPREAKPEETIWAFFLTE